MVRSMQLDCVVIVDQSVRLCSYSLKNSAINSYGDRKLPELSISMIF